MPRNVRNFWIELQVDGRRSPIEAGPVGKDGGFHLIIRHRNKGQVDGITHRVAGFVAKDGRPDPGRHGMRGRLGRQAVQGGMGTMTTYDPTICGGCGLRLRRPRPFGLCDTCRPLFIGDLVAEYARMAGDGPDDPAYAAARIALEVTVDALRNERSRIEEQGS